MPGFQTQIPNPLGKEAAIEKLKGFLGKVGEKFKDQVGQMDGSWDNDVLNFTMKTYGMTFSGTITVEESVVRLEVQLPFAAMAFRGKIEQTMKGELEKILG